MLRRTLLYLARSRWLRRWMEQSRLAHRMTARFIAGQSLAQEVQAISTLASEGALATVDFLGENVTSLAEAERSRDEYFKALEQAQPFGATVSLKLTQFGLDLSEEACYQNVSALVERARSLNSRVEIDMESSAYTQTTLDIVQRLQEQFGGHVRVAIQVYLHRTEADIQNLSARGIAVRLCKGAYREPASLAIQSKAEVDAQYVKLTKLLLDHGTYPAIAGHDPAMIEAAKRHIQEQNIPADRFEFQMLYGIRRDLQRSLIDAGYRVRMYVPYGDAWFPYFMRRLAERPANLLFLMRNFLRR